MHRWSILLFLSFFISYFLHFPFFILISFPLVSNSLFLLSFSPSVFSPLWHSHIPFFLSSSVLFIASCFHLSCPFFSLSHLLSLSTLLFSYSHHFSPCLILLSPIFSISPHISAYFLCSSPGLLVSSLPLSSCSHLLSSLFSPHSLI